MGALAARDASHGSNVVVMDGDLSADAFKLAGGAPAVAWDIETTGLDWRAEHIATVQVHAGTDTFVVRIGDKAPRRLKALLEDESVMKVMHHAMFDLRFMAYEWDAVPRRVACTKIAAKLAMPEVEPEEHGLAALVRRFFRVRLDKRQRTSDWTATTLDEAQVKYAADDVRFLLPLYERLERRLRLQGLLGLRDRCYAHLPTRVELELRGYPDVFQY